MKFFSNLFGKKPTVSKEVSLASKFSDSRDFISALDSIEEKEDYTKEVFKRPIGTTDCEVVSFDENGKKSVKTMKPYAMDEGEVKTVKAKHITPQNGDIINDTVWSFFGNDTYIGWSACAVLAQNGIVHLACLIPAEDAISSGYEFAFADHKQADKNGDGTPDKDTLTAIKKLTEQMKLNDVCVKLTYNKRVFGSGIAIPIIYEKDGKPCDMSNPFNADGLNGKKYKGFKVVDPYWLTPQFEEDAMRNPTNPRFMQPTWYKLPDGRSIHYTWFIKTDNAEVADILKPTYYYGGMPLTQIIYKRVWCAEKTANEAPLLAMSKRMLVVDANVQQLIKNKSYVYKLMQVITKCRSNFGVFFKSPTSNIQQIDTALTDFEECMFSQYQLVASLAQMPATKLLQTTPKGFNSTGEFEWKIYAQLLETIQARDFKPLLEKHLEILTAVEGKAQAITVTFNPIDAPSAKEVAEIENMKSNTRANYVQNGILAAEEVRDVLRNDEDGEFSSIDKENADLVRQKEQEKAYEDEINEKIDAE